MVKVRLDDLAQLMGMSRNEVKRMLDQQSVVELHLTERRGAGYRERDSGTVSFLE